MVKRNPFPGGTLGAILVTFGALGLSGPLFFRGRFFDVYFHRFLIDFAPPNPPLIESKSMTEPTSISASFFHGFFIHFLSETGRLESSECRSRASLATVAAMEAFSCSCPCWLRLWSQFGSILASIWAPTRPKQRPKKTFIF